MLCVKNVSLRLPESRLLTNVNFTVDKGDIVTLMGPWTAASPGCIAGEHSFVARIYRYDQRLQLY